MTTLLQSLIDKQDNFEVIRDQIGAILLAETANQKTLATAGGKDPALWDLQIFTERSNPWEQYQNDTPSNAAPIVNIWYETSDFEEAASNVVERQKATAIFNIDCYGLGRSASNGTGAHKAGDKEAAFTVQRALRLVRNILMADTNTYLQLRGLVWKRWPQSITVFQPDIEGRSAQQIVGARIAFAVDFNEFSPQFEAQTLETVAIDVFRDSDGKLLLEADYNYPIT